MKRFSIDYVVKTICILLLTSCESNSFKLVVAIPDATNLQTPCTVYLNGVDVGVLNHLRVGNQGQLYADLELQQVNNLPSDSEFLISNELLGGKSFQIKSGASLLVLVQGDTVNCREINPDPVKNEGANPFESFMKIPQKQDSILKELQRLNQNIEKVLKEKK